MSWVDFMLLITTFSIMLIAAVDDIKTRRIPNRLLGIGTIIIVGFNLINLFLFRVQYWPVMITNLICMIFISVILYSSNIWAAGDSKLLIVLSMGIPAVIYSKSNLIPVPGFAIIIITFAVAYLYVAIDTVMLTFKHGINNAHMPSSSAIMQIFVNFIFYGICILLVDLLAAWLIPFQIASMKYLFVIINFCAILILQNFFQKHQVHMARFAILGCIAIYICSSLNLITLSPVYFNTWNVMLVLFTFLINSLSAPYNYQVISTEDVKAQMIPAASTVLMFRESKIKNLPTCLTEDLRARLSDEQVNAIIQWKDSRLGRPQITIVRKIPFALFIAIGTTIFIGIGMIKL